MSELAGMLLGLGIGPSDQPVANLPQPAQARKALRLVHALTGVDPQVEVDRHPRRNRVLVRLPLERMPAARRRRLFQGPVRVCCQKSFLRGVMVVRGYLGEPPARCHLEAPLGEDAAPLVQALLRRWEVPAGTVRRRGRSVVYVKGAQHVSTCLGLVGASRALLALEGLMVFREVRNDVNRRLNFETANLRRGVESALVQADAVRRLEASGRLAQLPPALRQAAELRLRHPRAGLTELARGSGLGKSALNHRLRRLVNEAERLARPPGPAEAARRGGY
ncbi:MAG: DNA-binding protein WhiA [Candidatus Dormibacteria bacterium]